MKPSFYLEPDAEKVRSFFRTFSLHEDLISDLEKLSIHKIWIDEAENSWELEYSSTQTDPKLFDALSAHIKTEFNLKHLVWKNLQDNETLMQSDTESSQENVLAVKCDLSVPQTVSGETGTEVNQIFEDDIPLGEMPPDAVCDPETNIEEDESYIQAYNTLYGKKFADGCLFGKNFKAGNIVSLNKLMEARRHIVIQGHVATERDKDDKLVAYTEREVRGRGKDATRLLVTFNIVDADGGIYVKIFFDDPEEGKEFKKQLKPGLELQLLGNAEPDQYNHDAMTFLPVAIKKIDVKKREDKAPVKRVELHCHTKMSKLDAITDVKDLINTAIRFGHKALAITDHGVIQAFPFCADAVEDAGSDLKLIYGCEGYLTSDEDGKLLSEGRPHPHKIRSNHIIILAKDYIGLRNLYRLITLSHLNYQNGSGTHARPLIPRSILQEHREGLLLGSACEIGELYQAVEKGKTEEELLKIADFYDYLEIQPLGNNAFLEREGRFNREQLIEHNKLIYRLAKKLGKLCVATCDVHFLNPEDARTRAILQYSQGYTDADMQAPLYFRTTEEMLAEFTYFGEEIAYEVCVTNPNLIAEQIEGIKPVPDRDQLYSPVIPGAEEEIVSLCYEKAHRYYGEVLPKVVEDRLKLEMDAIIGNGYAVLYDIAHKLVKHSMDEGYLVGSRGSVGSSLVACMTDITEVNPLIPHYRCPACRHSEFFENGEYASGFDMPPKLCPKCGTDMARDGHNIPFAVFMGFHGDKVPDIDLNFSDEYQHRAHKYTEELFGRDNVCRAGTIATVAPKTAWSYAKKYFEEHNIPAHPAYVESFIVGLNGVKRTTGQHPAGIMVVPRDMDIHYITPMSHPADDKSSSIITTHYDYHSINDRLVKLDILGHVDPTMIKRLEEFTGIRAMDIPVGDPDTMSIFSSTEKLGVTPEQIGTNVGTLGIPECGTRFTLDMIHELKPKLFSDIVRVSGYSHGTNVWIGNAKDLIESGHPVEQTISTRDDVMTSLIAKGVDPAIAFKTMEYVRKGKAAKKGLEPAMREAMEKANVPEWYMKSCETVQYLFPKAHAVAYVLNAYRIAYCKVHYPLAYYAAYFSQRADVDATFISKGEDFIRQYIKNVDLQGKDAKAVDKDNVVYLQLVLEMLARGFVFYPIDLYKSHAYQFRPEDDKGIRIPLCCLPGVGKGAARTLALTVKTSARKFVSQEDLLSCCRQTEQRILDKAAGPEELLPEEEDLGHVGQTALDALAEIGALGDLPVSNQMDLFSFF